MIIVPVKEGENIERAIKKFKRKFDKTGVVSHLRVTLFIGGPEDFNPWGNRRARRSVIERHSRESRKP